MLDIDLISEAQRSKVIILPTSAKIPLYYRKEREFEETMDSLQNDIDSLESERGELKDKVKQMSKKVLIQGLTKSHSISDGRTL
jgi:hypothetical protein